MLPLSIPSPSRAIWHLGPVPIRAYAIAIIVGIIIAYIMTARRYRARGGDVDKMSTVVFWAIIFGVIGGRLYHVITDWQLYFGEGRHPIDALKIWNGGLGIWGAVALGAVGAWIGARIEKIRLMPFADAVAPGLLVAQAIGRIGNYFNQELFGAPTTLPWGLEIDAAHMPAGYPAGTTFHPTFLYEALWCLAGALVLVACQKWFKMRGGQVFALYIIIYTAGRFWIERLRIDTANHVLGQRLNVWTAIIVFVFGILLLMVLIGRAQRNPHVDDINLPETPNAQVREKKDTDEDTPVALEDDEPAEPESVAVAPLGDNRGDHQDETEEKEK